MSNVNDCPECGRSFAGSYREWLDDMGSRCDELCGVTVAPTGVSYPRELCLDATVKRLKARVAELELIVGPRLHVWELSGGNVWIVALTEDECWGYLEDQHGNTDEVITNGDPEGES